MLKFIYGAPASGKTTEILNQIRLRALKGLNSVLIVPEQFSFESERAVLKALGDSGMQNVTILSFSRLYDELCRLTGGVALKPLCDSDKVIFMNKALLSVQDDLTLWGKYCHSVSFAQTMLDTVGEFKINGITAQEIKNTVLLVDKPSLKNKLNDISCIYEAYDAFVGEQFIDPADILTLLYLKLDSFKYFENKTVFIDSFKGFTGQQLKVLQRVISQAEDVFISFTNKYHLIKEYNLFTNIRRTIKRIEAIANAHNIKIAKPLIMEKSYYNSKELSAVEALISADMPIETENTGAVNICMATTVYDEAEFAARTIKRLVRENNYRYRDFVIISRDLDRFEQAVSSACKRNSIPLFYDKRLELSAFPLARAVNFAINALDFSTENILRFHKTGLGTLDFEEILELENYVYLWNIDKKLWQKQWDMDIRGFVADSEGFFDNEALEHINSLRKRAIEPIIKLKNDFSGNAESRANAILNLISQCGCAEKLAKMSEKISDDAYSGEVLRLQFDAYNNILDSLVRCFGKNEIKTAAFNEALETAVLLESVGVAPQMLDEVAFGSADRIRPSRPKIAFILGANQGIFPKITINNGVFAQNERSTLISLGLELEDNSIYSAIDEEFLVYSNLCCASDMLYITYSKQTLAGEPLEPAVFVGEICEKLNCSIISEPQATLNKNNLPETEYSAFIDYCRFANNNREAAASIKSSLANSEYSDKINLIDTYNEKGDRHLSSDVAKRLYGKDIYMSATRFDNYNRCHFSYFCRYGLKSKKIQPADFDVLQRGTIAHYVFERIITEYKNTIKDFSFEKLDSLTDFYINEYLNSIAGYRSIENARTRFLVSRISRSLKEVVRHLALEFAQCDFIPVACELKIGGKDGIPLSFPYDNGQLIINGSIDRVDSWQGTLRIIDYKTGTKSFKLPDILFGLNLQMLIYLYAVIRGKSLPDSKAAGILYMPSKRDLNESGMAMNGLLTANSELVHAMDKENSGEFVPKLSFNKDGSLSKRQSTYISNEQFGEIFDYIEKLMRNTGNSVISGDIAVAPVDGREAPACKYCDFKAVCGIENGIAFKVPDLRNDEVFQKLKEGN